MPTTTKRRPMPADRCPICNAQNGEPCRNSINNKTRDRPHATRPVSGNETALSVD